MGHDSFVCYMTHGCRYAQGAVDAVTRRALKWDVTHMCDMTHTCDMTHMCGMTHMFDMTHLCDMTHTCGMTHVSDMTGLCIVWRNVMQCDAV